MEQPIPGSILVVGSINMDLAVRCPALPGPGETVLGSSMVQSPGGKGGNQAAAAAKLGGVTRMAGCIGADAFGPELETALRAAGVNTELLVVRGERSGVALIEVADDGENSIVVVSGANWLVEADDVLRALEQASDARVLLLQLEIPLPAVIAAAHAARQRGIRVLLDPAPARPLPDELLSAVDIVLPNQIEAALLTGLETVDAADARVAGARLRKRGAGAAVIKLGARGVLLVDAEGEHWVPGHRVNTVDTTAAGDCLAGALAVALIEGRSLEDAVAFANAAAALSTTRPGAQESMPSRAEVDHFLAVQAGGTRSK
jgi:ribokinase